MAKYQSLPGHTRVYVLIDIEPGKAGQVVESLWNNPQVALVDMINGPHSAVAVLDGADISALAKTVLVDIGRTDGVKDITVYLALSSKEQASHALAEKEVKLES